MTAQALDELVQVIVREIDPDQVYLFGSRARGTSRKDSDVDLLIVDSKPFGPEHSRFEEINRLYQALASFLVPKDILLCSSEEFAKWQHSLNHVIGRCYREGKLLYARSCTLLERQSKSKSKKGYDATLAQSYPVCHESA
jgi:predicted nucleotidyltransferase